MQYNNGLMQTCTYSVMVDSVKQFVIKGITSSGKTFRPSDWAERLAGVMSCFRPEGVSNSAHLTYSPLVTPSMIDDVRCVIIDERIRAVHPLAWKFLLDFARDNDLQTDDYVDNTNNK